AGLLDNFVSYKTKLAAMVQNFRTDLNEPDMCFVCGELAERSEFDQFSATVVQPVATYISNSDFIVTDGTSLLPDGIHFDEPSAKLLGERYADKILQHVYSNSTATKALKKNDLPLVKNQRGGLTIETENLKSDYRISDISGRTVSLGKLQPNQTTSISLKQGIYTISFLQNNSIQTVKQIIYE
ncbi:MAG: sialate O-acetylesterase, partial [Paludibacter sp.]